MDESDTGETYPFHYQFACNTAIADRERLANAALDIPGVVEVRELMTGQRNLLVEGVGRDQDDITRIARRLDELGVDVVDETMIKRLGRGPTGFTDE